MVWKKYDLPFIILGEDLYWLIKIVHTIPLSQICVHLRWLMELYFLLYIPESFYVHLFLRCHKNLTTHEEQIVFFYFVLW